MEYLRALARRGSPIVPLAVPRRGAGHGEQGRDGFASASFLRRLLRAGDWAQAGPYLLPGAQALLSAAPLSDPALAERAVLYRLRQMTAQDLAALPDCGEGLSERLYRAVRQAGSVAQVLAAAKTKRYPLSRLRRIVLWAFLGLTAADCPRQPSCLRVLGMNGTGRALLRQAARRARLPLLTKPAHAQRLSGAVLRQLELDARAADRYGLCFAQIPPCGAEWRLPPVVLP